MQIKKSTFYFKNGKPQTGVLLSFDQFRVACVALAQPPRRLLRKEYGRKNYREALSRFRNPLRLPANRY
jgi:hypothetical protein